MLIPFLDTQLCLDGISVSRKIKKNDRPRFSRRGDLFLPVVRVEKSQGRFPRLEGDTPRFFLAQFLVNPGRVEVGAVGPGQRAQLGFHLGEVIGVGKRGEDAMVAGQANRRTIQRA